MSVDEYRKSLIEKYGFEESSNYNDVLETLVNKFIERRSKGRKLKIKRILDEH